MDHLKAMSRSSHLIAWGGLLLFIFLFFDWQQVSISSGGTRVRRAAGWHGWGVLVGILAIALVAWEVDAARRRDAPDLPVKPAMISAGLAAGVLLFTVIKFLVDNESGTGRPGSG